MNEKKQAILDLLVKYLGEEGAAGVQHGARAAAIGAGILGTLDAGTGLAGYGDAVKLGDYLVPAGIGAGMGAWRYRNQMIANPGNRVVDVAAEVV